MIQFLSFKGAGRGRGGFDFLHRSECVVIMSPNSQSVAICIPQDVPHSTWVLLHMLCPKFNSHVYKLKRYNIVKRAKYPRKTQWSKPSQERQKRRPKKMPKDVQPTKSKEEPVPVVVGSYEKHEPDRAQWGGVARL